MCILVKAYPQPSTKYEETVCCAGVNGDRSKLLRLYPIRYRRLSKDQRFDRFDIVQMDLDKPSSDHRAESYRVSETSITIIQRAKKLPDDQRVRCWLPFVDESLPALEQLNRDNGKSLGIVRPDPGSVKFVVKPNKDATADEKDISHSIAQQMSLIEEPLKPLQPAEYIFCYNFRSGGEKYKRTIFDWEVQAAWYKFKKLDGSDALTHLTHMFQDDLPSRNLHFIMGNMLRHPRQFIIVGLLRTKENLEAHRSMPELDLF